ncbi:DUF1772 domain-containing protein [Aeromicrobium panaciterrae]|uniref:anthrone oxygenase family protein n=1 Tax=Aeromicrobium panaciterrae TaxID=363861 RepID=UPI0031E4721D
MTYAAIESVARVVSVVLGGIFTGFLLTILVLELSLRRFDASVYTQVRQVELVRMDALATGTLLPTVIAAIVLVCVGLRRGGAGLGLTSAALVLLLIVFVTTVTINLPINADQLDWSVARPPADWATDRDRWQVAHAVRTAAAALAFGCLVLASGLHRPRRGGVRQLVAATSGTPGR